MGLDDKVRNEAEDTAGKAKEWVGDKTDNPSLEQEGQADQAHSKVSQAGEHIKDAAHNVKDALTN